MKKSNTGLSRAKERRETNIEVTTEEVMAGNFPQLRKYNNPDSR